MDQKVCEICSSNAKIVCFCRKALLCELCIGKHFLDEPSQPHKPIPLSQTDITRVYEERQAEFLEDETRLIEQARNQQGLTNLYKSRITAALETLTVFDDQTDKVLAGLEADLCQQVRTALKEVREAVAARRESQKTVLDQALDLVERRNGGAENAVVRLLGDFKTVEEMQGLEVVKCRIETDVLSISEQVKSAVHYSIDFPTRQFTHSKTLDSKRAQPSPIRSLKTTLTPSKKPTTKLDSRPSIQPSNRKSLASGTRADSKHLGKQEQAKGIRPGVSLLQPKKDLYGRRSSAFEINPFPLLPDVEDNDVRSDEEFNLLADDDNSPVSKKPEATALKQLFVKMPTETQGQHTKASPNRTAYSKSPVVGKARVESSQVSKGKKPVSDICGSARNSIIPGEDSTHPLSESLKKSRFTPPMISITSPEGDAHARTPRRSVIEESTRQSVVVSKATEISHNPTQFSPIYPGCEPNKSSSPAFPQQTYIIPPGSNLIKVLDLDANTTSIKEFALPETEKFGTDLAWCCSLYGEVFLLGGRSEMEEALGCIYSYNPGTDELEGGCNMMIPRYRHCALYHQDSIYIIGGLGAFRSPLKDCERFDIRKKGNKRIGGLSHPRDSHSACIFEGKIYVAGGVRCDIVEVMVPQTEVFSVLYLKSGCSGASSMFTDHEKLVIIHNNLITYLWPNDRNMREAGKLQEYDWWCQGPAVLAGGLVYFVKNGAAYRFDPASLEMLKIDSISSPPRPKS